MRRLLQFFCLRRFREPRLFERTFTAADHPLRAELDQRYLDMRAAMATGEPEPIAALLAPHFASVDIRANESSAEEMINSVLKLDIDRSKQSANTTLVNIEESNGVARVLQHYSMSTSADVAPTMPKKLQTLSADTWLRSNGKWLLAKTQTLEMEVVSGAGAHRYLKAR